MVNLQNKTVHDDAFVMVCLRNEFYKKKLHLVVLFLLMSLFGIAILSSMLFFLVKNPPHPLYFVADPVGRLQRDIPISEPNMTLDEVTAWTVNAVQSAYTYSYMNYRAELQGAQKYFGTYGWNSYMKGLNASNNILALTQRKIIQFGTVIDRPQLLVQGHMGQTYAYQFRMPVLVTAWLPPYDDKSKFYNSLLITVIVVRADLLQSNQGLAIAQMNAEFVTS